jgi:hypothetical protein
MRTADIVMAGQVAVGTSQMGDAIVKEVKNEE